MEKQLAIAKSINETILEIDRELKNIKIYNPITSNSPIVFNLSNELLLNTAKRNFENFGYNQIFDINFVLDDSSSNKLLWTAKYIIMGMVVKGVHHLLNGKYIIIPCEHSGLWGILIIMLQAIFYKYPEIVLLKYVGGDMVPMLPGIDMNYSLDELSDKRKKNEE